jgi:hypothetical protein
VQDLIGQYEANKTIVEDGGTAVPMDITLYLNADRASDAGLPPNQISKHFPNITATQARKVIRAAAESNIVYKRDIKARIQAARDATNMTELDAV